MKRTILRIAALSMMLMVLPMKAIAQDADLLDSAEAEKVVYLLEFAKFKKEVLAGVGALWSDSSIYRLLDDQDRHIEMLEALVAQYDIDLTSAASTNFGMLLLSEELRPLWTNWGSWMFDGQQFCRTGAYLEEISIRNLKATLSVTETPTLVDAYSEMLADDQVHLFIYASHMYGGVEAYQAQVLSQPEVDAILDEAIVLLASAFEINAGLNDAWYDPSTNGQGFMISVQETKGTVFLAWFTYETWTWDIGLQEPLLATIGDAKQRWMTAEGAFNGNTAELAVYSSGHGLFDQAIPAPLLKPVGSLSLRFEDCAYGTVRYDLPGAHRSGTIPIERVSNDNLSACRMKGLEAD